MLRQQADHEIDLDEQGAINDSRISWEVESQQVADSEGRSEWIEVTSVRAEPALHVSDTQTEKCRHVTLAEKEASYAKGTAKAPAKYVFPMKPNANTHWPS